MNFGLQRHVALASARDGSASGLGVAPSSATRVRPGEALAVPLIACLPSFERIARRALTAKEILG